VKKALIGLIIAILAGIGIYYGLYRKNAPASNSIRVSGNIEITEVQISFKIPGRVEERLVDEGQQVQKGQIIARLDTSDLVKEDDIRKAEQQVAQAALTELLAGSRPQEIAAAQATVEAARADRNDAESHFVRIGKLRDQQLVTEQEFVTARARFTAADARLNEAQERLKLVREGPRKETIDQARARVSQGHAAVELA